MADVLIVGTGPTGLTLAIELLRRKISVRLIDEKETFSPFSKALALQSRSLELFEKMGMISSFLEAGLKAHNIHIHWKKKTASFSLEGLPTPFPFILLLAQNETEKILHKYLEQLGGVVEWQTRLVDISQHQAVLINAKQEKEIDHSPWIVGCDGAHSTLRKLLGFPFKGANFPEYFVLADFESDLNKQFDEPNVFLNPEGFAPVFPFSRPTKYRVIFPLEKEIPSENLNKDTLDSLMKSRGIETIPIKDISWISTFQIHRRMTEEMRHDNLFLAGDAAHIHSPVGGQGMNTGIQDAVNLAWKLALVIQGSSEKTLLDTYQVERHPQARAVLKGTTCMTQLLTFSQKWCPVLFWWTLKMASSSQFFHEKILKALTEIDINYRASSGVIKEKKEEEGWKGPHAGDRAPDAYLNNGVRLFDLLKSTSHVLLLFDEHPELTQAVKAEYGQLINMYVAYGEDIRKKYAAGSKSLYLIRPDGYISYRTQTFIMEELFGNLLKTFKPFSLRNKM